MGIKVELLYSKRTSESKWSRGQHKMGSKGWGRRKRRANFLLSVEKIILQVTNKVQGFSKSQDSLGLSVTTV